MESQLKTNLPFDLYELRLFCLVAETRSFTLAAKKAGLSQSALSRQIQGLEEKLGVSLLERTTRHVAPTNAGDYLHQRAKKLLHESLQVNQGLQDLYVPFKNVIRVGTASSIGMGYLPGFFRRFQKTYPDVQIHVVIKNSNEILELLGEGEIDIAVVTPTRRLRREFKITHSFRDPIGIILYPGFEFSSVPEPDTRQILEQLAKETWLSISPMMNTRRLMDKWLENWNLEINPGMELDNFDIIVNLVSIRMGIGMVPYRALGLYTQSRSVLKLRDLMERTHPDMPSSHWKQLEFERELAVVTRKDRTLSEPIKRFVEMLAF